MTTDLLASAQQLLPGAIDLRRQIHAYPELGNQLPATTALAENARADLDLEMRRNHMILNEQGMAQGIALHTGIALRFLQNGRPSPGKV